MIRVLNIVSALDSGGVENMLYNYYSNMDRSKLSFDFVSHSAKGGMLEEALKNLGSEIYHVTPKKQSLIKNIREINRIIKSGNYDIVQCHQNFSSFMALIIARLGGVGVRVCYAHGSARNESFTLKIRNTLLRKMNQIGANYFFACGNNSGEWLFGRQWLANNRYKVINNAIDTCAFGYNAEVRKIMRRKYNVDECTVLLHVGRFSKEKNHKFLLEIMKVLNAAYPGKYVLLLVGTGSLEDEIRHLIKISKIGNSVKLMGKRENISDFMSMGDVFLLPSFHEGFPVTLVEAQACGLKTIASNTIGAETKLTHIISYAGLTDPFAWTEKIIEFEHNKHARKVYAGIVEEHGFGIKSESKKLETLLLELARGRQ